MVEVKRMMEIDKIIRHLNAFEIDGLAYLEAVYKETRDTDPERYDNARMGIEGLGFTFDEYQEWVAWKEWSDWTKTSDEEIEASIREWQSRK